MMSTPTKIEKDFKMCHICGIESRTYTIWFDTEFPCKRRDMPKGSMLKVNIPYNYCVKCEISYCDYVAENIKEAAIAEYNKKMEDDVYYFHEIEYLINEYSGGLKPKLLQYLRVANKSFKLLSHEHAMEKKNDST